MEKAVRAGGTEGARERDQASGSRIDQLLERSVGCVCLDGRHFVGRRGGGGEAKTVADASVGGR